MSKDQQTTINRPFTEHFTDAIRQSGFADLKEVPKCARNAASKAAILQCIFAIEALANSITEEVQYSKPVKKAIDRFQPLEKFDFYLSFHEKKPLDRSCQTVQRIAQLFKLRNDYVHSKVTTTSDHITSNRNITKEENFYDQLQISKLPIRWTYLDAKKVIQYTDTFVSYYFEKALSWNRELTMMTICTLLYINEKVCISLTYEQQEILKQAKSPLCLKLSYLPIEETPSEDYYVDYTNQ